MVFLEEGDLHKIPEGLEDLPETCFVPSGPQLNFSRRIAQDQVDDIFAFRILILGAPRGLIAGSDVIDVLERNSLCPAQQPATFLVYVQALSSPVHRDRPLRRKKGTETTLGRLPDGKHIAPDVIFIFQER